MVCLSTLKCYLHENSILTGATFLYVLYPGMEPVTKRCTIKIPSVDRLVDISLTNHRYAPY